VSAICRICKTEILPWQECERSFRGRNGMNVEHVHLNPADHLPTPKPVSYEKMEKEAMSEEGSGIQIKPRGADRVNPFSDKEGAA